MKTNAISKSRLWTGRIMSGLVILFLLFDALIKFTKPDPVAQASIDQLGYKEHHLVTMGILALIPTILYLIPRTAVFGAVLLTGYLGGAIATHMRVDNPLFSHTLFPVYVAVLMWGGIWLRDQRISTLLPIKQ